MSTQNATNTRYTNGREQYLLQTLGLDHDPFAFSTAELELQVNSTDPPFLTYFVDLPADASEDSLLDNLKQPGHAIVYGAAGSGKTTLRYALEAHSRAMVNRILVVSQPLGKGNPEATTSSNYLPSFLEAFAIDLFVQVLEQFENLPQQPDAALINNLSCFWQRFIPNFRRTVERQLLQTSKPADTPTGISPIWWRTWKRVVVQYTPWTQARRRFIEAVLAVEGGKGETAVADLQAIRHGSELAHRLGYEHIHYLLDVADTPQLDIPRLMKQLRVMEEWETAVSPPITLSFKLFLPERLQKNIQFTHTQLPAGLISPSFSAIISWKDPELLKALIANRFRSAGSWIRGLEVLSSQEIASELPDKLIEVAANSPRRLLQIIHMLLNIHASHAPDDPLISTQEWQETCAAWTPQLSHPTSLMVHSHDTKGNEHDQCHTTATCSQYPQTI